ncbi:MAG: glycosyltransferase family 4 protein [Candidatus Thermoplasmatota archaeon]|nr:glycosyltransferase family 4 protein [Candidatus Thermoplasmatota archaeon]
MLSAEYPPRWGGMGSTVYHLSASLAARGHRVTVITRSGGGDPPSIEGVEVISVGWARIPMAFTRSYGRSALRALKSLNATDAVDVVHLHCPMISWSAKQFRDCRDSVAPVVCSLHGSWLGERDGLIEASRNKEAAVWANPNDLAILMTAKHYAGYERAAIRESSICVANSEATKQDFMQRYSPLENWDCEVVHWGVDTSIFEPLHGDDEDAMASHEAIRSRYNATSNDSRLLLAVGRLAARKGYASLLRAFASVNASVPSTRLVIVGRGHLRSRLSRLAKSLGVGDSVYFEPGMPFEDLAELFRSADLVVYPSYYEGQGLIPLEAMASGTPVVTVNHGPLPEMVDESVGRLFKMGDESSMAEAILAEMGDPKALRSKGEAGRHRVLESFTYEGNSKRFEVIYGRA